MEKATASPYATVKVDIANRPSYMSPRGYLADCALAFKNLCKNHQKATLHGEFDHSEIVELYELLGYELPEHLRDMTDIPTKNGRFVYTIVFNPDMDGTSAK